MHKFTSKIHKTFGLQVQFCNTAAIIKSVLNIEIK